MNETKLINPSPSDQEGWPPALVSLLIHGGFVVVAVLLGHFSGPRSEKKKPVEFEVVQFPKAAPALTIKNPVPEKPPDRPPEPEVRKVFGVSRKALTASASAEGAAEVKTGNTVTKEMDDLNLEADDADSLPIPADEFLVESMPVQLNESKVVYPENDRKDGIEGPVMMDLLIDHHGKVRQVDVISGPSATLKEAAKAGAFQFVFRPAKIKDQAVAVKIRYTYRFVLEAQ